MKVKQPQQTLAIKLYIQEMKAKAVKFDHSVNKPNQGSIIIVVS